MKFKIPEHVVFITEEQQEQERQERVKSIRNILNAAKKRGVKGSINTYEIFKTYIKSINPTHLEYETAIRELSDILSI